MKRFFSILLFFLIIFNCAIPGFAALKTEENDYIKITQQSETLNSRLAQSYTGYVFTIKNIYNEPVFIKSVTFWNNANAKIAYLSVKQTDKEAASKTFQKASDIALPTLGLSYLGSLFVVPFSILSNKVGNNGVQKEAKEFDKTSLKEYTLKKNEQITLKTMVLNGHKPYFRITFKNPLTDEFMNMEMQ